MTVKRLTREDILNSKDIEQKEVFVKEWNGNVLVQALSGKKRAEILDSCMNAKGKLSTGKLYPALMISGCVEPTFTREDTENLNEKNSGALETVVKVVMKLSGISADDLEETEKNS